MDIYSFLNSKDIAEHCRSINKTWNPFEMAVIIGRSHRHAMSEKHKAWREIIITCPDMPTPKGYHHESYPSLHKKLEEAITYETAYSEKALDLFKMPEQGAVYMYGINGDNYYDYSVFSTYEQAFANLKKDYERNEVQSIKMRKSYLDDSENMRGEMRAVLDYNGNAGDIDVLTSVDIHDDWFPDVNSNSSNLFSRDFYVIIPTPFKKGDILTYASTPKYRSYKVSEEAIFVYESINHDDSITLERRMRYEGDSSDMWAWGYIMCDDGISEDHMYDYDRLEYYRGKLEGNQRFLQYVSWYLKGEMPLTPLLDLYCKINNDFDIGMWRFPDSHIIADGQADHENDRAKEGG